MTILKCCIIFEQENLKKFRDERKKLEEADALLKAREKFVSLLFPFLDQPMYS